MTRALTSSLFTILFLITPTSLAFACKGYEAPTYVGAMNRAQQAYYLEHNQYASSISQLGLGIKEQTESYIYRTHKTAKGVLNYGISKISKARKCEKKCVEGILNPFSQNRCGQDYLICLSHEEYCNDQNYVGAVFVKENMLQSAILCKSGDSMIREPIFKNNRYICSPGSQQIN